MNDTIIGVIIGGIIAILGSFFGLFIQYKIDTFKTKIESRKIAYINALKWIDRFASTLECLLPEETLKIREDAIIGINLYGSKKVLELFNKIKYANPPVTNDINMFKMLVERELGFSFRDIKRKIDL